MTQTGCPRLRWLQRGAGEHAQPARGRLNRWRLIQNHIRIVQVQWSVKNGARKLPRISFHAVLVHVKYLANTVSWKFLFAVRDMDPACICWPVVNITYQ